MGRPFTLTDALVMDEPTIGQDHQRAANHFNSLSCRCLHYQKTVKTHCRQTGPGYNTGQFLGRFGAVSA
jgi:hypothetical protein